MWLSRNSLKILQNVSSQAIRYHHDHHHHLHRRVRIVRPARLIDRIDYTKNHYHILGLERCASLPEIKDAFYSLAKKYHPDNNGENGQDKFQEIVEAYNVLINEHKMNKKDRKRQVSAKVSIKRIGEKESPKTKKRAHLMDLLLDKQDAPDTSSETAKLSDLLQNGQLKMATHGTLKVSPPQTLSEASINIDFLESVQGLKKHFMIKCLRSCPKCCCKKCKGIGIFKTHFASKVCDSCQGKRVTFASFCEVCQNKRYWYQEQRLYVVIPPGIYSGDILKVRNPISENPSKCIRVKVNVSESDKFIRNGFNIHSDLVVSVPESILGSTVKVPTIHGVVEMKIPSGAKSNSTIILYGKGIRTPKVIGDHIVTLKVEMPKTIHENVRKALSQLHLEKGSEHTKMEETLRKGVE